MVQSSDQTTKIDAVKVGGNEIGKITRKGIIQEIDCGQEVRDDVQEERRNLVIVIDGTEEARGGQDLQEASE